MSCDIHANSKVNVNLFKIIKKCNYNFETKIHKALLIKKNNPDLIDDYLQRDNIIDNMQYILNCYFCYLDFFVHWLTVIVVLRLFCACIFKSILNDFFFENIVRQIWLTNIM